MSICGVLFDPTVARNGHEYCECLRPDGHAGPHLVQRSHGEYVAIETDYECECDACQSDDIEDWCTILVHPSVETAQELIVSKESFDISLL